MFADVGDLQDRWRALSEEESSRAAVLLDDASAIIEAECPGLTAKVEDSTVSALVVKQVVCGMVKRAMVNEVGGVSDTQDTAGPFMHGVTYANPMGDLYLTRADKRRLGYGGQRASSVDLAPEAEPPASWYSTTW
jgi:Phage protein Gp19/Gp15/Gp42